MKEQNKIVKTSFFKKIFIKICRIFGYEIIDQSNFYVPTQEKSLNENLNIQGKKSITLPLGETKISRRVNTFTVIFRSCTNINMLTQNKKRLFNQSKSEYTFRSLNSVIVSLNQAKINFPKIKFNIIIVDHSSKKEDLEQIKRQLKKSNFENSIISLDVNEFIQNIKKVNAKNENVTENQISNMSNIHKSLLLAKNQCEDLVYFVEDDYLHKDNSIEEMVYTYEKLSTLFNDELFLCPVDYPYLYMEPNKTNILIGNSHHWRRIDQTLCTFLTSSLMINKHFNQLVSMCEKEHYPFEKPLHDIYKKEYCFSLIPSLAVHFTNINSVYGISPNVNLDKLWKESE